MAVFFGVLFVFLVYLSFTLSLLLANWHFFTLICVGCFLGLVRSTVQRMMNETDSHACLTPITAVNVYNIPPIPQESSGERLERRWTPTRPTETEASGGDCRKNVGWSEESVEGGRGSPSRKNAVSNAKPRRISKESRRNLVGILKESLRV